MHQNKPFSLEQYFEGFVTVASETVTDVLSRSFIVPRPPSFLYYLLLPTLAAMNLNCSGIGSGHVAQAGLTRDSIVITEVCTPSLDLGPFYCPIGLPLTELGQTHNRQLC